MTGERDRDPVFGALAEFNRIRDQATNFYGARRVEDLASLWAADALRAIGNAERAVMATKPATPAGAFELLEFVADSLEANEELEASMAIRQAAALLGSQRRPDQAPKGP
jgi:hypothetical protein